MPGKSLRDREVYRFGEFSLDPTAKVLFRGGQPVHLTRKAVETLLVLVENAGQVLTKEEILKAVWGDRVVDEANLTQNIAVIRKALQAAKGSPAHIETFPGRGYRLEGPVASITVPGGVSHLAHEQTLRPVFHFHARAWLWGALAVLASGLGMAIWSLTRTEPRTPQDFRVVPVTRMPGKEFQPAISPDGRRIAFLWSREGVSPPGVWVKEISGESPRALTAVEGHHSSPAWSSDGRRLAYLRVGRTATQILIADAVTGTEQIVSELAPPNYGYDNRLLDWSPDGQWLVVSHAPKPDQPLALLLVSASTGERRSLTDPGPRISGDVEPRFSPDGKTIAFVRMIHRSHQELFLVPAAGGPARQLTSYGRQITGVDWTRDGRALVYASDRNGEFRLWRMPLGPSGPGKPAAIGIYGQFPIHVSLARRFDSLVYSHLHQDRNIWRLELNTKTWKQLLASSAQDASPSYSPAGDRICFRSDRSGEEHLWVSRADGSDAVQVTRGALRPSVGRWSPDGRAIVFNNPLSSEIFIAARRPGGEWSVRSAGAKGIHPVFSPDGQWIYAGGTDGIRRIPVAGGTLSSVFDGRALSLDISRDGKFLYFVREPNGTSLWRVDLDTGALSRVLDGLVPGCSSCWAVSDKGVYYLGPGQTSLDSQALYFRDFESGHDHIVAPYPEPLWPHGSGPFSLSPDGRYLLCVRVDPSNSDVMLVEPFL